MNKIFLIIDESGAKGYSDKQEVYAGEVGVIAGYLVPEQYFDDVKSALESIKQKYFSHGKVHITDLSSNEQESLRSDIYKYFIENNICCIYEAIHSEGFFDNYKIQQNHKKELKKTLRSKIKTSNHENKELLHKELFQGTFGKAIAKCIDCIGKEFELVVITDNIDDSIKKQFICAADEFVNIGTSKVINKTGFDPDSKKIVTGSITSSITNVKDVLGDFSKIKYSISCEDSGLTLAADVIANSINYHFKSRKDREKYTNLHDKEAMKNHPLIELIYGFWTRKETNYISDAIFMHPKNIDEKPKSGKG